MKNEMDLNCITISPSNFFSSMHLKYKCVCMHTVPVISLYDFSGCGIVARQQEESGSPVF